MSEQAPRPDESLPTPTPPPTEPPEPAAAAVPEPAGDPDARPAEPRSESPARAAGIGATPGSRRSGWATACHLVGLIDFGVSVLFVGLFATFLVWLVAKDSDPEADFHGKEALNFQLNVLFWQLMAVPLVLCCLIGIPLGLALPIVKLVLMLVAAARAANGERWTYPLVFRVIR